MATTAPKPGPGVRALRLLSRAVGGTLRAAVATRPGRAAWRRLKIWIDGRRFADLDPRLSFFWEHTPPDEWAMMTRAFDDSTPLPPDAARLVPDSPRLRELRLRYAALGHDHGTPWQWHDHHLAKALSLQYFRGDSPYVWQYRDLPRTTRLKFYLAGKYVQQRDQAGLLATLGEDGAFGCWTHKLPGLPRLSRDLLDSVNELSFLDRQLGLLARDGLRVLDIGAGYGRLAVRTAQAVRGLADYCCVDAVPESTFLSEYYLRHRGVMPPARVVPLDEVDRALAGARFDIAFNVHSFSECTYAAVAWWLERLARLRVPHLFLVPNEPEGLLSREPDDSRRDLMPLVAAAGYELVCREPVYTDPEVRQLVGVDDHHHLFRLRD